MRYVVTAKKPVEHAIVDLAAAVTRHGYVVLQIYDLQATLKKKGVDMPNSCHLLEICNPRQVEGLLKQDMTLNVVLPCRISVYEDKGETRIALLRPTALLAGFPVDVAVAKAAGEVEETSIRIIEEAKQ